MATTLFHFGNAQEQAASVCRTGSCCDSGVAKSLFRSRQKVRSRRHVYQTREGANADIFESGVGPRRACPRYSTWRDARSGFVPGPRM
jgi:hypothetical protein